MQLTNKRFFNLQAVSLCGVQFKSTEQRITVKGPVVVSEKMVGRDSNSVRKGIVHRVTALERLELGRPRQGPNFKTERLFKRF
jgi:hypothetical protein